MVKTSSKLSSHGRFPKMPDISAPPVRVILSGAVKALGGVHKTPCMCGKIYTETMKCKLSYHGTQTELSAEPRRGISSHGTY